MCCSWAAPVVSRVPLYCSINVPRALIRPCGWDACGAGMAPPAPGAPGQPHPWDSLHREGAAEYSCSPCPPLILPHRASGSAQGTVVFGNQRSDSPGWFGHGSVTFCHLCAHPSLCGCGAGAWGWSSSGWEISASQGCCRLHRKAGSLGPGPGTRCPSPCWSHAPGLPVLPSPQLQVPGT